MNINAIGYLLVIILWLLTAWLLLQPLPSYAEDIIREDEITTRTIGSTHGWVYNTKTKILRFCMQTTGDEYDTMAVVVCIPYPKRVELIKDQMYFFLDHKNDNKRFQLPFYKIER
jgi:hypothetical protein